MTGQAVPEPGAIDNLLQAAGYNLALEVFPVSGGANNRAYSVITGRGKLFLKAYFHHAGDRRDRLGAEFAFSRYAWDTGIRCIPQPLACDRAHHLGLYEFIDGRPVTKEDLNAGLIDQAIAFYRDLNQKRDLPAAFQLAPASEACFNLTDHLNVVQGRIDRLQTIPTAACDDLEIEKLIHDLENHWREVKRNFILQVERLGVDLNENLSLQDRCLSPSDFGFHNALLDVKGKLTFIDFEYAGWDDPAKLVCDFFCQPAVAVPQSYFEKFTQKICDTNPSPEKLVERVKLLFPVYQVKWACILLNEFMPVSKERRAFARGNADQVGHEMLQLEKARSCYAGLLNMKIQDHRYQGNLSKGDRK